MASIVYVRPVIMVHYVNIWLIIAQPHHVVIMPHVLIEVRNIFANVH